MSTPERLREILVNKGSLKAGSPWTAAVAGVRRELFLPKTFEAGDRTFDRRADPKQWAWAVYADLALTTQINEGRDLGEGVYRRPTSSSSMPTIMLQALDLLDVHDGHRLLEAGTGTGYNAAWLCHRLGPEYVTTMDIDPEVAEQARANLAAAGFNPRVLCGNAEQDLPPGETYHRVLGTYTVADVPYTWIERAPGGRIVTPWGGGIFHYSFVVLDVEDERAHGRFAGHPAFMSSRARPAGGGRISDVYRPGDKGDIGRTTISPRDIADDHDALFWTDLMVRDAWHHVGEAADGSDEATLWLFSTDRSSWATAEYVPGHDAYETEQYGPRRLWDEVETAYRTWQQLGTPDRDRTGLTVDREGQHVWLDEVGNRVLDVPPAAL
ncbi:methyltransferase domain-containing protein [Streptomyces cinnamoneus]|uniref:methyltransferase domain-containing protein n=1 Tax=Streptomyces cinnamoneus TaxID=53446 RepID=UPI00343775B3